MAYQDPYVSTFGDAKLSHSVWKKVRKLIRKRRFLLACDGSYKNGVGSFAWGLMDRTNTSAPLLSFLAPLHGDADQTSPLRSELYALLVLN